MSARKHHIIEEFEIAVRKRALASSDGHHGPHDVEIAQILYDSAKAALVEHIKSKDRLITQLSRSSH